MQSKKKILKVISTLRAAADALEELVSEPAKPTFSPENGETQDTVAGSIFLKAMRENCHKLKGRMTVAELSDAIGMKVGRGDRVAIGLAVQAYGATRGKSGSTRYYIFNDQGGEGAELAKYVEAIKNARSKMNGTMRLHEISVKAGILLTPENRGHYQDAMSALGFKYGVFRGNRYYDMTQPAKE